jgi:hypothetical protein
VRRRIYLRAGALGLGVVAVVSALTVYFSTQKVPPCLVTGIPKWQPPTDKSLHRFELVVPDRALCFFDMDHDQALVGYVKLPGIRGITSVAPRGAKLALRYGNGLGALVDLRTGRVQYGAQPPAPPSDQVLVYDEARDLKYVTRRGVFGVEVSRPRGPRTKLTFPGYTWNPRFGPDPPDHGLSLAPDRPELWVLDAPNNVVHVFNLSGEPRDVKDIRLTKPLIGVEDPCASRRCGRIGSLQHSADGRFVYVGDVGDVIDTKKREEIANLEALHQSRLMLEVDWVGGKPEFPASR